MLCRKEFERCYDKQLVRELIENTAQCCVDAKTNVFGYSVVGDVRHFRANEPFGVVHHISGVIGVVGREFQFDENLRCKVDADFCLQVLIHKRIVWVDRRFSFNQKRTFNKGGNSIWRTSSLIRSEIEYLKRKWGKYYNYKHTKVGEVVSLKVER
jgi:hypothetical protein